MGGYTTIDLRGVEDQAPNFDMPAGIESRFARRALGGETFGLSLFTLAPGFRMPFGHKHTTQEEAYIVLRGSARIRVEDEVVDVGEMEAIRFDPGSMRAVEAGTDGVEYLAVSAGDDPRDAEMTPAWWSE
jgi:uncharacterized cupin superfamily protein